MQYSKDIRRELLQAVRMSARAGQSMTSLLVGIAIMGCVGAGAATISRSSNIQEQTLSARSGAAELMDTLAGEIRTQTRYSDLAGKYGGAGEGGTGWKTLDDDSAGSESDEFIVRTTVRKTCNDAPSTNCDTTHVDIEIVDKNTGETVLKQTVSRVYTHFEEPAIAFVSSQSPEFPPDAIAMRYVVEGGSGNNGTTYDGHGYDLKINSEACEWDYKPNSTSPRPNGCVACPSPTWKQYRNGDCSLFTCPTGQKANAAGNGCEAITCTGGTVLSGDTCIVPLQKISSDCIRNNGQTKRLNYRLEYQCTNRGATSGTFTLKTNDTVCVGLGWSSAAEGVYLCGMFTGDRNRAYGKTQQVWNTTDCYAIAATIDGITISQGSFFRD